jgi:hypothetical protein
MQRYFFYNFSNSKVSRHIGWLRSWMAMIVTPNGCDLLHIAKQLIKVCSYLLHHLAATNFSVFVLSSTSHRLLSLPTSPGDRVSTEERHKYMMLISIILPSNVTSDTNWVKRDEETGGLGGVINSQLSTIHYS